MRMLSIQSYRGEAGGVNGGRVESRGRRAPAPAADATPGRPREAHTGPRRAGRLRARAAAPVPAVDPAVRRPDDGHRTGGAPGGRPDDGEPDGRRPEPSGRAEPRRGPGGPPPHDREHHAGTTPGGRRVAGPQPASEEPTPSAASPGRTH